MPQEPQYEFEDVETYRGFDDKISFRLIVLAQLQRIAGNANVEFRGGYWQQKAVPTRGGENKIVEEYVPDTREVYSNSIIYLHDLLYPHFKKEKKKEMREASENYETAIKDLLDGFMADGKFTDAEKIKYREERVKLCRKLFMALSCFLERVNYFGERAV